FCMDQSTSTTDPVIGTLDNVTNIVSAIAGFIAVLMIVIAGFQMITSSGNSEKISTARNTIIYAAVGLIVIAIARLIIEFIINKTA
ncbi:MAG TPA: hypothetical protein VII94_00460, partial [Candidatus Saccharimonadales bacterium]